MNFHEEYQSFSGKLNYKANLYFDRLKQMQKDCNHLVKTVKENKNWLNEKHPVLQEHLNHFQFLLQERTIGFFSELVSTATQDILEKDDKIVFDLSMERQMPSLKIFAQSTNLEDITSGGMINVIATALRSLVLWRVTHTEKHSHVGMVKHRKFLFLDEPDCWIFEGSIPKYARFLYELSEYFGIQIVMVSHKNIDYFKPYARVYEIKKPDSSAQVDLVSDIPFDSQNHDEYIASVRLRNIKSFRDTKIELHPKMTVISGHSHVGKSVIIEAFKAIIHNDSADTLIRHHENQALIHIEMIEQNKKYALSWERVRQTHNHFPQKVRYTKMIENQGKWEKLNEEYESKEVPEFARQLLKMDLISDVEVHLGFQSDMDFLFDKKASGTQRAKLLSLGKETDLIHQAMKKLKQKKQDLSSENRYKEKEYDRIINLLETLPNTSEQRVQEAVFSLNEQENTLKQLNTRFENCGDLLAKWEKIENHLSIIKQSENFHIIDHTSINNSYNRLENLEKIISHHLSLNTQQRLLSDLDKYDWKIKIPDETVENCENLKKWIVAYQDTKDNLRKLNALQQYCAVNIPNDQDINDTLNQITKIGKQLKQLKDSLKSNQEEYENACKMHKQITDNIHHLEKKMGVCPCCQRVF